MTEHVWINGPDGIGMHCVICGLSRVEHTAPTCEAMYKAYAREGRSLEWKRREWLEYLNEPDSRKWEPRIGYWRRLLLAIAGKSAQSESDSPACNVKRSNWRSA